MLSCMEYRLFSKDRLNTQMSSLFHGALMETLDESFAAYVHESMMHPYAQHLERRGDEWYWVINTLSKNSDAVIRQGLKDKESIYLSRRDLNVIIQKSEDVTLTDEELKNIFYNEDHDGYFQLRFLTPTAFKRRGEYLFIPDLFCSYQSLMNRYDSVGNEGFHDEDALQELAQRSRIIRYDLRSTVFSMEGVRIPSFLGKVTIKLDGTMTMKRFAHMLFRFGEFSGVGIKTSLGMGAITLDKGQHNMKRGEKTNE